MTTATRPPVIDEVPRYRVPQALKGQFLSEKDEAGLQEILGPFIAAPDLQKLALSEWGEDPRVGAVAESTIFLWKAAGGSSGGKVKLGKATKLSGLTLYLASLVAPDYDFVVWLAADNCQGKTEAEIKAVLFHELLHCGYDEDGRPTIYAHDVTTFFEEVVRFGLWSNDLKQLAFHVGGFEQAALSGGRL